MKNLNSVLKLRFQKGISLTRLFDNTVVLLFCYLLSGLYLWGCAIPRGSNGRASHIPDQAANQLADDLNQRMALSGMVIQVDKDNFRQRGTQLALPFSAVLSDALAAALSEHGATITVQEIGPRPLKLVGTYGIEGTQLIINIQARRMGETASRDVAVARAALPGADLDRAWFKPKSGKTFTGRGTAIISHQCGSNEKPCPPKPVMISRALRTAKLLAMRDLGERAGINMNSLSMIVSGRLQADEVTTKSHGTLRNLRYLEPVINDDRVSIELMAEVD